MTTSAVERAARTPPPKPSRFWEDLAVGEETRSRALLVEAAEMIEFALKYDPQYFHTDPEAARDSLFGGLIGSGLYSVALWRRLDHEVNGEIAWACGVAWENVRWNRPVRPGDTLYATSRCVAKRESAKRPDAGLATLHHELINQRGETVVAFDSVNLAYRRRSA